MRYAVIMAGGAGRRLWPLSRSATPKQLLKLVGGKSLMEMSVERVSDVFDPQHVLIVTNCQYVDAINDALPQVPRENIIGEPEGRDTANAIALAAELLVARDPDATMAVFTADHVIRPVDRFAENVRHACDAAERHSDALLTFGVHPTWPNTGLGYIQCDREVEDGLHRVLGFKEKPDHQAARRYVESGNYYWNSGMFVWKVRTICEALERFLPDSIEKLAPVAEQARRGEDYTQTLREVYPQLEKISIDYAVMENAPEVLMVELSCEWLDVGSWPSLENVCEQDDSGNVAIAENTVLLDSFRNVVVSPDDHLIAMVGMDDCIVVHSADATLVCNKSDSQRLKELVEDIYKKYGHRYL